MKEAILRKFTLIGSLFMAIPICYLLISDESNVAIAVIGFVGCIMFLIGTYRYGLKF
jgi:hypothetical protein